MTDWPGESAPPEAWGHIDTQVLGVAAASITFSGISTSAAPRLRLYVYAIKDGTTQIINLRLNNDSGANYAYQRVTADGVTITAARSTAQTSMGLTIIAIGANDTALIACTITKSVAGEVARATTMTAAARPNIAVVIVSGEWDNTADLINRVDVISATGDLDIGTRTVLEGAA